MWSVHIHTLGQGYSIRNPKGPLGKFPGSGSGTVTVKIQKHNSNKKVRTMHKRWCGLALFVWKVTPFCALNLGIKDVRARRRHWCKCSLVSVLLYLFCTIFMVDKADSQQYVEVCTLLLCGWSNYYTACCLVWWLQLVYFSGPYLRVLGVILFEVCMLCFIVTFHVTTFDKGNRLVAD